MQYAKADISQSLRIASASFSYVRLSPMFNSASLCAVCAIAGSCLRGGLCGDNKSPTRYFDSAPSIRVSSSVGATLTADLRNFPVMQIDTQTNLMVVPNECLPSDLCGVWLDPPSVGYRSTYTQASLRKAFLPKPALIFCPSFEMLRVN